MALVFFSSELQKLTGEETTRVSGETYREIVGEIVDRYADISREKLMGMAVAIDGEIVHDPLLEPVGAASEVHFLYRIEGG